MNKFFILLFTIIFTSNLTAQEEMQVIRCTAPELQDPINNIYVDRDNKKWVGNEKGLFQVHAIDYATKEDLGGDEENLLGFPDGNYNVRWSKSEMSSILGGEEITAGYYDTKSRELWIGTAESGVYRLKTTPKLSKVGEINSGNSKLKSDHINAINKDRDGRFWIGTESGVLVGTLGKWKLQEKLFDIQTISINREHIWVMGDDVVWKIEEGDEWYPIDITERMAEGGIRDIAADSKGRVWIASEIVIRYDYDTDGFQLFGPAQYFTSQDVNYIAVDKDDALWVGTQDKGLYLIEKASSITITAVVDKPLSCNFTRGDASLKVKITGGQPPFEYRWDGGLKGENPANLGPGVYALTVTDDNGKTKSSKVEVPDPRFTLTVAQEKSESGAGAADAVATVSIEKGGAKPFKYQWDNGETTATAKKLTEGQHSVTVSDKNGCTTEGTVLISQILAPLQIVINQTAENNCDGDNNASLEVNVSGGKAPYQYKWNENLTGNTPKGLAAGNYLVTVTDATGTTSAAQFAVESPTKLTAQITIEKPASTGNSDGRATAKATGGSGNYTFKWDTGESNATASKLNPGEHSVTISDGKGCQTIATTDISENILPLSANIDQTAEINCNGEKAAVLQVNISGGKAPFKYNWSNNLSGENPKNIGAGDYNLTVTDATGLNTNSSISIKEPTAISAKTTVNAPASTGNSDGKATVKADGGSGNYTYKWDNGETNKKAEKLSPGSHSVTITDSKGCETTATVEISENILELSANLNQTAEINCNGAKTAALTVEINGGKAPFTIDWNNANLSGETANNLAAGDYQITVKDVSGKSANASFTINEPSPISANITVNAPASTDNSDGKATAKATGGSGKYTYKWDNGETAQKAEKLNPGAHSVTVTDSKGCETTATVEISENILELSANLNQTAEINCNGAKTAALTVEINGGKAPFTIDWNNANLSGESANNLAAGDYQITVKDVSGKSANASFTINEPTALSANISVEKPASTGNSDGKATANATGGSGNYSYQWDNGESAKTAEKLAPGKHSVTISDTKGCETVADVEITENILPLAVNISQTADVKCFNGKGGALSTEVSGGKAPFTYQWSSPTAKGEKPNDLAAGEYLLTITDAVGQTKTAKADIAEPAELSASIASIEPASDLGVNDGRGKLVGRGGVGNFTYKWANGETTVAAKKLAIGQQTATVTDGNGCQATIDFEVKKRIIPELQVGRLRVGQVIRLSDLNFDADSTVLRNDSKPILDEIFYFLDQNPTINIEIGGHTNGVPTHEYCDRLSSARAKSIATYLYGKGVSENRVAHVGYGKRKPLGSNQTAAGRRRNQRVELKILGL